MLRPPSCPIPSHPVPTHAVLSLTTDLKVSQDSSLPQEAYLYIRNSYIPLPHISMQGLEVLLAVLTVVVTVLAGRVDPGKMVFLHWLAVLGHGQRRQKDP